MLLLTRSFLLFFSFSSSETLITNGVLVVIGSGSFRGHTWLPAALGE